MPSPQPRLIGRDPEAELRIRRALDQISAIFNSLLLQGYIVQTGQASWAIPDTDTMPVFFPEEGCEEGLVIPGPAGRDGRVGEKGAPGQDGEPGEDGLTMLAASPLGSAVQADVMSWISYRA